MASGKKLMNLNFDYEVENFEAFGETKEVKFTKCPHKNTEIENGWLRCKCGGAWTGPAKALLDLQKALKTA